MDEIVESIKSLQKRKNILTKKMIFDLSTMLRLDDEWKELFEKQKCFREKHGLSPEAFMYLVREKCMDKSMISTSLCASYLSGERPSKIPSTEPDSIGRILRNELTVLFQNDKVIDMENLTIPQLSTLWYYRNKDVFTKNGIRRMYANEDKVILDVVQYKYKEVDLQPILQQCDTPCPHTSPITIEYSTWL